MFELPRVLHSAIRLASNIAFDLRFGGFAGGTVAARAPGTRATGNTDYAVMGKIFEGRIQPSDVLVDVGCGKGRVLNWWLRYYPTHSIVGLELLPEIARSTRKRLARYENVQIVEGDAILNLPERGTLYFLFNPFHAELMVAFRERLRALCRVRPRRVLYYAPVHLDVFENDPDFRVTLHAIEATKAGKFEARHGRLAEIRWVGAGRGAD